MASSNPNAVDLLPDALEYLERGFSIFPVCSPRMGKHSHGQNRCTSPGKTPLVAWAPYQERQANEGEVRSWWGRWPMANIGLVTGAVSGVVVLDCDSGDARSIAMGKGGLDTTPAVWTGKPGGIHYHLEHPIDEVRNFARRLPGLDFRGDGGYALLPPSMHASGKEYRWNEHTDGMRPAPIPPWLWELLHGNGDDVTHADFDAESFDVNVVLEGVDEGSRDDTLFRYAAKMRGDNVPQAYAERLIVEAARRCRPAFPDDEALAKVRNAYRRYEPNTDYDSWLDELSSGPISVAPQDLPAAAQTAGAVDADPETPWQVFNAEDFLAIEFPAVEWRVEGYLRERAIMFSFGAPGAIKTFVATDAAIAIASGGMFLGKFACQQGRVLVVQEDTLASDYQQSYLRPMLAARGITGADVRDTLFVAPPADFSLDQQERLTDLCRWLEAYKPDMVVLDSFYLMYSGKKEDLIQIIKILKRIRNKYGCAIWIIDHNRKGQGAASAGDDAIDRLINGREKSAACDSVMESRNIKGEQGSVFLDVIKLRGAKLPEAVRVTYSDGSLTIDGDEEVSLSGATNVVYEWLCREGGSRTKAQISTGTDLSLRSVEGALYTLKGEGMVKKVGKVGRADTFVGCRKSEAEPMVDQFFRIDDEDDA